MGLPPIKGLPTTKKADSSERREAVRFCDKCGQEGQVISNQTGIHVFCNPCKRWWPISSSPLSGTALPTPVRGMSKMTLVEPDWNMAFEPSTGDVSSEQVGPKKLG
jgi:hypothetical protein